MVGVDVDPGAVELATDNCQAFDPPLEPEFRMARIPKDVLAWNKPIAAAAAAAASAVAAAEDGEPRRSGDDDDDEKNDEEEHAHEDHHHDEDAAKKSCHHPKDRRPLRADTVVMNPPFGTRKKGADMGFLRAALGVAKRAVYSLHKTSTRAHIERHALVTLGAARAEVLAELRYELPRVYAHHRQATVDIEVDLWYFEPPEDGVVGGDQIDDDDDDDEEDEEDNDDDDGYDSDDDWGVEREGTGGGGGGRSRGEPIELRYAGERERFGDRSDFFSGDRRGGGGAGRSRGPGKGARARALMDGGGGGRGGRGGKGEGGRGGGGGRGRGGGRGGGGGGGRGGRR